jgi:two-component sensor histidine kinase
MNAIRHAFEPDGQGTITVEAEYNRTTRGLVLTMSDDGRGLGDAPEGSGSKIIRALAQQLSATLTRTSGAGLSYRFVLTLPE